MKMSSQITTGLVDSAISSAPISNQSQITKAQNPLHRSRSHSPNSASDSEPPVSALIATVSSLQVTNHSPSVDGHLDNIDQLRAKISETKRKITNREQKEQGMTYLLIYSLVLFVFHYLAVVFVIIRLCSGMASGF